jgi:hypothetical protein
MEIARHTVGIKTRSLIKGAILVKVRFPVLALAAAAAALPLAACGGGPSGGSTTCAAYQGLSTSGRQTAVTQMIKTHGGDESPGNVGLTMMSADAYCVTHSGSSTISGIYQG